MKNLFALLLLAPTIICCEPENIEEIRPGRQHYLDAIRQVAFDCQEVNSQMSFEGRLNGEPICYSHEVNQYRGFMRRGEGVQLSSNNPTSVSPSSGAWIEFGFRQAELTHLKEEFILYSPTNSTNANLLDLVETYITEGPQAIRDVLNPYEGFNIKLLIPYDMDELNPGMRLFSLQTATGDQANSRLEITELEIQDMGSSLAYNIQVELNCSLYNEINDATDGEYFGELTEGVMKLAFSVPK